MDPAVYRLVNPNWMSNPDHWVWRRPDGAAQGFGMSWRDNVGLANLQWLSMNLDHPPADYDAHSNKLYMWATLQGHALQRRAEILSLRDFALLNPGSPESAVLIQRAIRRAHAIH